MEGGEGAQDSPWSPLLANARGRARCGFRAPLPPPLLPQQRRPPPPHTPHTRARSQVEATPLALPAIPRPPTFTCSASPVLFARLHEPPPAAVLVDGLARVPRGGAWLPLSRSGLPLHPCPFAGPSSAWGAALLRAAAPPQRGPQRGGPPCSTFTARRAAPENLRAHCAAGGPRRRRAPAPATPPPFRARACPAGRAALLNTHTHTHKS